MTRETKIISIFGQIEEVVARQMLAEAKGVGLLAPTLSVSLADIPLSTRFNYKGDPVRMVIVMPRHLTAEFERRIAELRA